MSERPPPARSIRVPRRIAIRLGSYFAAAWSILALLAAPTGPWAVAAIAALALYTTLPLVVFLRHGWRRYPGALFRIVVVRTFLYTQLALPFVAGAGAIGLLVGAFAGVPLLMGRWFAAIAAVIVAVFMIAGYIGSKRLRVHQLTVRIRSLPAAFEGMRIVQICDTHIGPQIGAGRLRRIANTVSAMNPDLLAIPGDLIDDRPEDVAIYARFLGSLTAPLGVFMSPGNHEVYQGWPAIERALRGAKIGTLLVNESRIVTRNGDRIAIVGTGDPAGRMVGALGVAPDIERALSAVPPGMTTIALAHNPLVWPELAARGVALTLSGHTHGGQFGFGSWNLAAAFLERTVGHYRLGDEQLYISPGTGYWGIPFRIGVTSEITELTLMQGEPNDPEPR